MTAYLLIQLDFLLRILGAALCGALLGYERESLMKMAGIRTHTIVALASSLMMIVSKYGFYDVLRQSNITLDPSRIAAGVVTAIGFLGAGIIFTRKMNVIGVVTAAGIWTTVGIGIAFGAGMYLIGIATTLFLFCFQLLFHRRKSWLKPSNMEQMTLQIDSSEDVTALLTDIFSTKQIRISNINAHRLDASTLEIKLLVKFPEAYDLDDVVRLLREHPQIKTIYL